MKYDVFISYSRKDIEFAKSVCTIFDAYKQYYEFEYFFDVDEIKGGHEYLKRIATAISESKVMLFLASENSTRSKFCTKELLFADNHKIHIHQYRIDNTVLPKDIDLLLGNHHYREAANFSIDNMVRDVLSDALKQEVEPISELAVSKEQRATALVRVESDIKCRVLRFGKEFAIIDNGISELYLPKGKQKLSFVSIERDADRVDHMLDIRDLEYEEYIEIELLKKNDTEELDESDGKSSITNAIIDADNDNTGSKQVESNTAKTYKVGDYYDDGEKQGVVFEVSADGKHGKIISLNESANLKWSSNSDEQKRFIGSDNEYSGAYNMAKVKQIADWRIKYPAFYWCAHLGFGWYLPAKLELLKIYQNKDIIEKTLSSRNGRCLLDGYWSSTEDKNYQCSYGVRRAWSIYMPNGNAASNYKLSNNYVRAVAAF